MAWTQADLDALKAKRAKGIQSVRYADKGVTYQGDAELSKLQGEMEREIAAESGLSGTRTTRASFTRD